MLGGKWRVAFDLLATLAHSGPVKLFLPWYPFRDTPIMRVAVAPTHLRF